MNVPIASTVSVDLHVLTCHRQHCGIVFAIEKARGEYYRDSHISFYCPNGHSIQIMDYASEEQNPAGIAFLLPNPKQRRKGRRRIQRRKRR